MAVLLQVGLEAEMTQERSEGRRQGLADLELRRGTGLENRHPQAAARRDQRGHCTRGATAHDGEMRRRHRASRLMSRRRG